MLPERSPARGGLDRAERSDWAVFLKWTNAEGWRVPALELALYRDQLADSAFVWRGEDGTPVGFITVCRHQRAGWIGNLIVAPEQRGAGVGRRLFQHATEFLAVRGAATLWLTASATGLPLYASCGFRETGRIERWVGRGIGGATSPAAAVADASLYRLARADAAVWGDSRAGLLALLAREGQVLAANGTVALLQAGATLRILGPWLSADLCPRSNRAVLAAALEGCADGVELAVDLLGGSPVKMLLKAAGFRQAGETVLMARGEGGRVRFNELVALASLGSMG